ncbi:hypothetical protein L6452_04546 [Arctium lappa]|uniref:Uncharacterized protein n=1 Tax=Arctium lappa TaxID=4217 RepID=A0ACB9EDC2_ARCLA|nr:hypothetical protein L6452_04546 [Arctium lappa]
MSHVFVSFFFFFRYNVFFFFHDFKRWVITYHLRRFVCYYYDYDYYFVYAISYCKFHVSCAAHSKLQVV